MTENTRSLQGHYDKNIGTIAKRLHKKYPNDLFLVSAEIWSRPRAEVRKKEHEMVQFKIYSTKLKKSTQDIVLRRAYDKMVILIAERAPREVVNFMKEEM